MREKDIKRIFDINNGDGEETVKKGVDSEKVKAAVMEKIGMSAAVGFYTDDAGDEAVKPVFVAVPKKKRSWEAVKIAAAGAAAFLGVTMCAGMFGKGGIYSGSPQNNAENNKNVPEETVIATDVTDEQNVNSGVPGADKSMELVFLDGVHFIYDVDKIVPYYFSETDAEKTIRFLYEKNGRLYVVMMKDGKETAEDITDKISSDDFYLYTYNNPDNTANQTHYVIIGGDVSNGDYGYVEIFKIKNSTNYWGSEANFSGSASDYPAFCDSENSGMKWIANGVKEIAERYGVAIGSYGYCDFNVDFNRKDVDFSDENKENLTKQLTLLDGSRADVSVNGGESEFIKPEYPVNANGQTYYNDTAGILSDDYPDLVGVIATNGKEGYVYKEDLFDYSPSCPEEAVKYMEVLKELNDQGIYFQIIPVYAVDGETVIGDFEIFMDVGMCGDFSMDEAGAIYEERRKLYEESRANGKYLRESMASVMERAIAKDKK